MSRKIRVLIVEDSPLERLLLREILAQAPDIEVVDVAPDAGAARNKMRIHKPDGMTLDVKMPGEDGIAFLTWLMSTDPLPVIMVSAFTRAGAKITLSALEKGAVDFVAKPDSRKDENLEEFGREIIRKVRAAARARMGRHPRPVPTLAPADLPVTPGFIVAIGSSMGGPEALRSLLPRLPVNFPAILLVQHMPEYYTKAMAESLDKNCAIHVKEAEQGEPVLPGRALIASGNFHMELRRLGARYFVEIHKGPRVRRFRPSVDVLFESVAQYADLDTVGVILTGMGGDGANGISRMKAVGAHTIAQDEASSVIFGMPKEAIETGAVDDVFSLEEIPGHLIKTMRRAGVSLAKPVGSPWAVAGTEPRFQYVAKPLRLPRTQGPGPPSAGSPERHGVRFCAVPRAGARFSATGSRPPPRTGPGRGLSGFPGRRGSRERRPAGRWERRGLPEPPDWRVLSEGSRRPARATPSES